MTVTAVFMPDHISATPGETAALTLKLFNATPEERVVKLRAGGGLAAQTVLQSETIYLDPNEHFEVPVIVDAPTSLAAGPHSCVIEVDDSGETVNASATIDVLETTGFAAHLEPVESASGNAGRHRVVVDNRGNVPIVVELGVDAPEEVTAELAAPMVNVDAGKTAKVELRLTPHHRFWSGVDVDHPFNVAVTANNNETATLDGVYHQRPRMRPWVPPFLAGLAASLLLGTVAWFAVLRPSVRNIARDEAATLDATQDQAIADQVAQMQDAAEESSQLPLGVPVDNRFVVAAAPGTTDSAMTTFDPSNTGRVLSITDIVFQNPDGAVGRVALMRGDEVLLESNLTNFRDLDFHFVAPFRIESGSDFGLSVTCETPGPGADACNVSATIVGFVKNG